MITVRIFPFSQPKDFFSAEEQRNIIDAIKNAEQRTSGEIRVYVEKRCKFVDPIDRAAEIFFGLKMDSTEHRNATLVYLAYKDHQLAVFGDDGIHQKVGPDFWKAVLTDMREHFLQSHYAEGLVTVVQKIGEALHQHFPYERTTDKNELPDDIVFGR